MKDCWCTVCTVLTSIPGVLGIAVEVMPAIVVANTSATVLLRPLPTPDMARRGVLGVKEYKIEDSNQLVLGKIRNK